MISKRLSCLVCFGIAILIASPGEVWADNDKKICWDRDSERAGFDCSINGLHTLPNEGTHRVNDSKIVQCVCGAIEDLYVITRPGICGNHDFKKSVLEFWETSIYDTFVTYPGVKGIFPKTCCDAAVRQRRTTTKKEAECEIQPSRNPCYTLTNSQEERRNADGSHGEIRRDEEGNLIYPPLEEDSETIGPFECLLQQQQGGQIQQQQQQQQQQ